MFVQLLGHLKSKDSKILLIFALCMAASVAFGFRYGKETSNDINDSLMQQISFLQKEREIYEKDAKDYADRYLAKAVEINKLRAQLDPCNFIKEKIEQKEDEVKRFRFPMQIFGATEESEVERLRNLKDAREEAEAYKAQLGRVCVP